MWTINIVHVVGEGGESGEGLHQNGASTKFQKSPCFLKASPACGRGRFHQKKKNTDFFVLVLAGVVHDIREGQPQPPQTDIFWGGGRGSNHNPTFTERLLAELRCGIGHALAKLHLARICVLVFWANFLLLLLLFLSWLLVLWCWRHIKNETAARAPTVGSGPHPSGPHQKQKIGQMRSGQNEVGLMRPVNFGQMWHWPNSAATVGFGWRTSCDVLERIVPTDPEARVWKGLEMPTRDHGI